MTIGVSCSAPGRSRSPTRSARRRPTRAPCRCRFRRSATGASAPSLRGPPARTAPRRGAARARRRTARLARRCGCGRPRRQVRAGSATLRWAGGPEGSRPSAPTAIRPHARRETLRGRPTASPDRSADGRRTPPARRPLGRSPPRTEKSPARDPRWHGWSRAARPPRPDLRADVVDHRHTQPLDRRREAEIEVGKIDQDQRVRPIGPGGGDEPAAAPPADRGSLAIASVRPVTAMSR